MTSQLKYANKKMQIDGLLITYKFVYVLYVYSEYDVPMVTYIASIAATT